MHRRVPQQNYQKKRPLSQIAKEVCDDGSKTLDTKTAYQDPYLLDEKQDDTNNWDNSKPGREKRALFDNMLGDFSQRLQASARRQNSSGSGKDTGEDVDKLIEREVCDKIECLLKPFFMKHKGVIRLRIADTLTELCRVLVRCGVNQSSLADMLTGCVEHSKALVYLPCVSTTYVRVTVVLKVETGVVKQFAIENGWRKESAFVHH